MATIHEVAHAAGSISNAARRGHPLNFPTPSVSAAQLRFLHAESQPLYFVYSCVGIDSRYELIDTATLSARTHTNNYIGHDDGAQVDRTWLRPPGARAGDVRRRACSARRRVPYEVRPGRPAVVGNVLRQRSPDGHDLVGGRSVLVVNASRSWPGQRKRGAGVEDRWPHGREDSKPLPGITSPHP